MSELDLSSYGSFAKNEPTSSYRYFSNDELIQTVSSRPSPTSLLQHVDWAHQGIHKVLDGLVKMHVPLADPLVCMLLSQADLVNFAFWSDDSELIEIAKGVIHGNQSYQEVVLNGFWNRVWTWINDYDVEAEHQLPGDWRLKIAEIHTPHVSGCIGTFATSQSGSLDVSISGFGLGYKRVSRIAISQSYELPEACCALTTGIKVTVHVWKNKHSDKRRLLIDMIKLDGTLVGEDLGPEEWHPCGKKYDEVFSSAMNVAKLKGATDDVSYTSIPMRNSPFSTNTRKLSLEEGVVYSAAVQLPFQLFAATGQSTPAASGLGISIESKIVNSVEMSWKLVSGHDYLSYRAIPGDMRMFWAWT